VVSSERGLTHRHDLVESRMLGNGHVRFGGRPGETDQPRGWHRAPGRPLLERLNKEIKRRTDVPAALLRLAGAVLVEAHDEWQVSDHRYLSEGSMALLAKRSDYSAEEVAQPALIAS
jgi:hypothetical protein